MTVTLEYKCANCGTARLADVDAQLPIANGTWLVREVTRGAPPLTRLQLSGALALVRRAGS